MIFLNNYFEVYQESQNINELLDLLDVTGEDQVTNSYSENFVPDRNLADLSKIISFTRKGKNITLTITRTLNVTTNKTYVNMTVKSS